MLQAVIRDRLARRYRVLSLLLGGIRYRFRVRGGVGVTVAVGAALTVAVVLGACGNFLGWRSAAPLPRDAEVLQLAGPALPPGALAQPQRWDFTFDQNPEYLDPRWFYLIGGTDEYRSGKVFFQFTYSDDQPRQGMVKAAGERLRAAGWHLHNSDLRGCCPEVAATKRGWLIEVFSEGDLEASRYGLQVALTRTTPASVLPLTAGGLVVGGLLGWLLTAGAFRRAYRLQPARRTVVVLLCSGGLLAVLPATLLSGVAILAAYLDSASPTPGWLGYTFLGLRPLAYLGGTAVAVGLLLAAASARGCQRPVIREGSV
ncbi:hypothetical protein [Micromonospora sp. RTGN7]|uniref:hypothetical protein n=1 Tax=Micromonospora sp. RTGN7 TaxID=3016526 RepID=UPI0029FF1B8E|nr:hypothetical protein [Micromonospora sp. RTGN7]